MFCFQTCWKWLKHLVSARTFSEMLKAVAASWNPKHVATPQGLELLWTPLNSMESVTPGLQPGPCQTPKQNAIFRIRIQIRKDRPPNMHHVSIRILYIYHPHFSNMGLLHSRLQWLHVWVIELEEAWCLCGSCTVKGRRVDLTLHLVHSLDVVLLCCGARGGGHEGGKVPPAILLEECFTKLFIKWSQWQVK